MIYQLRGIEKNNQGYQQTNISILEGKCVLGGTNHMVIREANSINAMWIYYHCQKMELLY